MSVDNDFAHPSEHTFAELFDFYGVAWQYEPTTFVLARDDDGHPTRAFAPDFYLPDFDTYVEITTMRQALVTKKNRKIRQLRERYPNVRVTILYARDVAALFDRHGIEVSVAAA